MGRNKGLKLLFVDILTDNPEIKKKLEKKIMDGSYGELFRKKLGLKKSEFMVVYAPERNLPNPKEYQGIIVGGSLENPVKGEEKPWMRKVYTFIGKTINQRVPLLGVCGGHQFIARALGQRVIYNPKGRELGTVKLTLTKEGRKDLLLRGISKSFFAQLSHQCIIEKMDQKWRLLASSKLCKIQAVAINDRTRIVQFHPEFSADHIKSIAKLRREALIKEGFVSRKGFRKFLLSIKPTRQASKILQNFIKHFVLSNLKNR